jgi:chemotaxis regulatin CheY-phosphate phosphatase CheZ
MKKIISNLRTARMAMVFVLAMLTTLSVQAAADKTALNAAISEAETYHSSIVESNPKQAEFLTMLINVCKETQNDADATQEDVDFAVELANESVKQCKIAVAQANFDDAISKAEEYLDSIKENYPAQAEKLNNIINNVKAIDPSSLEVMDYLTKVLIEGIKEFKLEIAQADYAAAISQAEEYMASLQEKHPEQAKGLAAVIDFAKSIGSDATSAEALQTYTKALTDGIQQMQLEIAQADFAAAVADAEAYLATIQETHPEQAEKLNNIINNVKAIDPSSLELLDYLTQVLNEGIKVFKMEVAHADLAAAIADAEAYMASIQESNASVAGAMQMFINLAKQLQDDDSYEQADIEYATAFMKELVVQAKEFVTTGVSAARAAAGMAAKYYDLHGRRVSQPSRAGVYINNGVKVASK